MTQTDRIRRAFAARIEDFCTVHGDGRHALFVASTVVHHLFPALRTGEGTARFWRVTQSPPYGVAQLTLSPEEESWAAATPEAPTLYLSLLAAGSDGEAKETYHALLSAIRDGRTGYERPDLVPRNLQVASLGMRRPPMPYAPLRTATR